MLAPYISFSISTQSISSVVGCKSSQVIRLPDGGCIYRVTLWSGQDIIVRSSKRLCVAEREYMQDFWIYDKKFHADYRGMLNLLFTSSNWDFGSGLYEFIVDRVHEGGRWNTCRLQVNKYGVVIIDNELVSTDGSKRMLCKAMMLCAGDSTVRCP